MVSPFVFIVLRGTTFNVMDINQGNPLFAKESKGNPHELMENPVTPIKMLTISPRTVLPLSAGSSMIELTQYKTVSTPHEPK